MANKSTPIDVNQSTFDRKFTMDEAEYEHIRELNDNDEYIDFEIPADAPEGKKYSDMIIGKEEAPTDLVPVDLSQEFGE